MLKKVKRKDQHKTQTGKKKSNQNTGISKYLSTITLNVSGLNASIKRHRLSDWIKKQDPTICCLEETPHSQRHTQTKSERLEKDLVGTWKPKASRSSTVLISDKENFMQKLVRRDKEGHYILIKETI
jgi:exonuclease III